MAASVRIEDEAFNDIRYERLAAEAGLADADHARGKMARLWRQCTLEHRHVLPVEDVVSILGPAGEQALISARLGDKHPQGVRIRGTRGRIEWLRKLRENGTKGGRPKKPDGLASGSPGRNPPAPAPAAAQGEKTKDPPNPPLPADLDTPRFQELWNLWVQHRKEIREPLKPTTAEAQLKKLAKEGEPLAYERVQRSIENGWQGLWFKEDRRPSRGSGGTSRDDDLAREIREASGGGL